MGISEYTQRIYGMLIQKFFAIVFLMQVQKYDGVFTDTAAMVCNNCYEHKSEFAGSGHCPPPLI